MPYSDPERRREYQRQWVAQRRADYLTGKSCEHCGATASLEIHHRDPELKLSHRVWSWSAERRASELAKCIVLCQGCHDTEHYGRGRIVLDGVRHGRRSTYERGCRCAECRAVEAARMRRKRANRSGLNR